jgi:hypothetical protein
MHRRAGPPEGAQGDPRQPRLLEHPGDWHRMTLSKHRPQPRGRPVVLRGGLLRRDKRRRRRCWRTDREKQRISGGHRPSRRAVPGHWEPVGAAVEMGCSTMRPRL